MPIPAEVAHSCATIRQYGTLLGHVLGVVSETAMFVRSADVTDAQMGRLHFLEELEIYRGGELLLGGD